MKITDTSSTAFKSMFISAKDMVTDVALNNTRATIKLCTETGLGVSCTSKTIEFTPCK